MQNKILFAFEKCLYWFFFFEINDFEAIFYFIKQNQPEKHYLVKWCALSYEDSTWEREADIESTKISEFEERCSICPLTKKVVSKIIRKNIFKVLSFQIFVI